MILTRGKPWLRLLLCLCFLWPPSCGLCYEITAEQLETLESNLTALQANNERLTQLLTESNSDLAIARNDLNSLLNELAQTGNELWKLKAELIQASDEAKSARQSLAIANVELANACASVQKLETERKRVRRQRTLWQTIAAVLGGVAIAR